MGQDALQAVAVQLFLQPLGGIGAGAGDLDVAIADVGHFLQRESKVLQILALLADGIELSSDFHGAPSSDRMMISYFKAGRGKSKEGFQKN